MASMKFEKNSVEFELFGEFYKMCQRVWIPEGSDAYWERAIDEVRAFYKKYKDADDIFVREIGLALLETLEKKYKQRKKAEI